MSEFQTFALPQGNNTDGTFDYRADNTLATDSLANMARAGIGLQSKYYVGQIGTGDPQVAASRDAINSRWLISPGSDYLATCGNTTSNNKGCSYAMFNVFKGLRLQGITSLVNSSDWYAEYVDYLINNQSAPQTTPGGGWIGGTNRFGASATAMVWSCCTDNGPANAAIAELILSPVTLVPPDPTLFSTVGLSPSTATNPVGTDHTVTAFAQSASNTPVPGATIGLKVLSGPNMGATGTCNPASCISGADGKVLFTYHDTNGAGHDTIQANIGTLLSNIVDKFWIVPTIKCDANGDGIVSPADLLIIRNANGQVASGPTDPRDGNSDGNINLLDVRYCQLRLTASTP